MPFLASFSSLKQWLCFVILALIAGWLLELATIPAALLLGPMLCAIFMGVRGAKIRMPKTYFKYSQGFVGCLIAHVVSINILLEVLKEWELMLIATLVTMLLSVLVGILSVRFGRLPGSTAAWGTSPGGASAMVAMAEDYGADVRVVATMQYIRVICVVLMAALVSHLLGGTPSKELGATTQLAFEWNQTTLHNFAITLIILVGGVVCGRFIPAGYLLIPMLLGAFCQLMGWVQLVLPHELLVVAYGIMGGYIGLRFDRDTLRYVMYAMPVMISASMSLIILCGISALGVAWWLGVDYLSAYLATSPGGLDSLSIVAIDVHADVGLVVAMQTLRLFAVIMVGPVLTKFIARFALIEPSKK